MESIDSLQDQYSIFSRAIEYSRVIESIVSPQTQCSETIANFIKFYSGPVFQKL